MNKTVKYVNERSIEEIIKYIEGSKTDLPSIMDALKESRKEYGLKIQALLERLEGKA